MSLATSSKPWLAGLGRRAKRMIHDDGGTTAIEFAMVAPLVIAIILASIQVAVIYLAQAELENAAERAARIVYTGQAPQSASAFKSAVCGYLPALISCSGLMVDVQSQAPTWSGGGALTMTPPALTYGAGGAVTNSWNYNTGSSSTPSSPGSLVLMRVMYLWPVYAGPLGLSFADQANSKLLLSST